MKIMRATLRGEYLAMTRAAAASAVSQRKDRYKGVLYVNSPAGRILGLFTWLERCEPRENYPTELKLWK